MGNRFVTQGHSNEATHRIRDDEIRQTGAGRRPNKTELAIEQVRIPRSLPKVTTTHNGATNVGLEAKESAKSPEANGLEAKKSERKNHEEEKFYSGLEAKSDESSEAKSREDAKGRSASTVHRRVWNEQNGASARTKMGSETLEGEL